MNTNIVYKIKLLALLLIISLSGYCDGFVFRAKAAYPSGGRHRTSGISIGNKGYFGLGHVSSGTGTDLGYQDWWEYDPATNTWTQKADYPHLSHGAVGFSIGNKGYLGSGDSETLGPVNDFYEYDPVTNIWTQKANAPMSDDGNVAFTINGQGYMGLGFSDLYKYDPVNNSWSFATSSLPHSWHGTAFVVNNKAYILPAYGTTFYMFDPSNNSVTTKASFIGLGRVAPVSFSLKGLGFVGLGAEHFNNGSDLKDFYVYDPVTDVWDTIQKSFPGVRRHFVPSFVIGDNAYFGTGSNGTNLADFWSYEWKIDVGIEKLDKQFDINLFPNPTTEFINVSVNPSVVFDNLTFKLFQLDGKEVLFESLTTTKEKINITHLTKGIYLCSVISKNEISIYSQKIVIN